MNLSGMESSLTELRCGVLVDGTGATATEDMSVILDGSRIVSVGRWRDRPAGATRTVIDLSDCTVTPGLVDGHTHICWGPAQSQAWTAVEGDAAGMLAWGLTSCSSALSAGVTTLVDCGSPQGLALTVRDFVQAGLAAGPRVLAAGEAVTTTAGHGEFLGTIADDAAEMVVAIRRLVRRRADLIKVMVTGGALDPHSNRRQSQYTEAELKTAIADAHRLNRKVVGHANATAGIVSAVAASIDIVAHCNWLGPGPGTVLLDMPTIDLMASRGTFVDLNLQGARRALADTDGVPVNWPTQWPTPSNRWELLAPLRKVGIEMYLTSDAFGPGIGSFPTDLAAASQEWGLSVEALLAMVTSVPARAFGLTERGELSPGKIGDIAVFAGDMRASPEILGVPEAVYQDGKLVVQGGMIRPPEVALAHRAESLAQFLLLDEVFHELD